MKKILGILALILTLVVGGYYFYKWFFFTGQTRALAVVPRDAVLIVESRDPHAAWKTVSQTEFWRHLSNHPDFAEIDRQTDFLDSLVNANPTVSQLLGSRYVTLSLHKTSATNFDFLYVLDLRKGAKLKLLQELLQPLLSDLNAGLSTAEYKGRELLKYYDKTEKETLHFCVIDNLLLVSYKLKLIYSAVDERDNPYWEIHPSMVELKRFVDEQKPLNVYVNVQMLPYFFQIYSRETGLFSALAETFDVGGFDLDFDDADLVLGGMTMLNPSGGTYLHALADAKAGRRTADRLLPRRTALFASLQFDEYLDVYQRFEETLKKDPAKYKSYADNVKTVEKLLGVQLKRDLLSWFGNEICFASLTPKSSGAPEDFLLLVHTSDVGAAQERMDFIAKQIKKRTPVKFKSYRYKAYEIHKFHEKAFFKLILGKLFAKFDDYKPYYTFVKDFVVFSNNAVALQDFLDDYDAENVLVRNDEYNAFVERFEAKSHVFCYVGMEHMYSKLPRYTGYSTGVSIQKNEEYVRSFRHMGMEFRAEKGGYRSLLAVNYTPYQAPKAQEIPAGATQESAAVQDSAFKETYPNGDVKTLGFYRNGQLHGEYKSYYKNGMLKEQGAYNKGEKTGKWYYYDRKGRVEKEENY